MRVCFYTLGCKVNLNETGALEQMFRSNGFTIVQEGEPADVFVVNSCTVTNFGDQKSRKWLRRAKRENPGAVTVLTGCYPQAFPDEAAEIAEADVVTGSGNRHAILTDVQKVLNGEEERVIDIRPHEKGERFEELPMDKFAEHTRAFVKVEDGCNRRCAYCVIPRARGPVRSRDEASVLEELRRLTDAGYEKVGRAVLYDHAKLGELVQPGKVDCVLFNFGWLPGAEHTVHSTAQGSLSALCAALDALRPGGVLAAVLYSGKVIGDAEKQAALAFFRSLPLTKYTVLVCEFANWADTAPLPCFVIKK